MAKIYQSATQLIGNTPLLEVTNLERSKELEAKLLVKLEYFNPSGSVKDRAAYLLQSIIRRKYTIMTTSDPIADMLTRIRNANTAKHDTVTIPSSKMKLAIADILVNEGYIAKYDLVDNGKFKDIKVTLKYGATKNEKIISGIRKISKPGLRVYAGKENMPSVLGGLGIAIVSTNQGVMTDREARAKGVGGEVLAFVW